jgi:phospho-N-acetylmuramoyl-pentapeptide-transferase
MLYYFLVPLAKDHIIFNVFRYLTFRSFMALISAFIISLVVGPWIIRRLRIAQHGGETIREDTPERHRTKKGTPTMGGLVILTALIATTLLWANLANRYIWVAVLATSGFGLIGVWDDATKLRRRKGISTRVKFVAQVVVAFAVLQLVFWQPPSAWLPVLAIPFFKGWLVNLGWLWIPFTILVVVGASNAVNLTDGLDGLAIMPTVMIAAALAVFAYVTGHAVFSRYLGFPYIAGAGELAVFCGAMAGAGLAFLWFNAYPAEVFMGDVGALALGAALGTIAVVVRQEIVLFIMGGVFVAETLSVMIQVIYFKVTGGKRIFRMAPLHHHYELEGWKESQVVVRFWIITMMLVLFGLSTLKLR